MAIPPTEIISPLQSLFPPSSLRFHGFLSLLMAEEGEKKRENQEAMFPKTATQRQHLLRLANS